jgi:hypothetical protein
MPPEKLGLNMDKYYKCQYIKGIIKINLDNNILKWCPDGAQNAPKLSKITPNNPSKGKRKTP